MASRLYPTTRRLFEQVVWFLSILDLQAMGTPTAVALCALYVSGLILLDRRQTPWRMQDWLPARCHDALNRLLRVMPVSTRALMCALALFAKGLGLSGGYLCVEDVIVEKTYSRLLAWAGSTFSFALKRKVWGLHIVLLTWRAGIWRIPVALRLWRPAKSRSPARYRTKLQLVQEMLLDLLPLRLPFEYVAFDTNYTAGWFTKWLTRCGILWVGTLDPKTTVHYQGKRYSAGLLTATLKLRWRKRLGLRARAVCVYAPKYGTLRLVVSRNPHGNYECILTNDLQADLTRVVVRKRSRWSIETVFRDSKQFAGWSACQCRTDQAWVRHVALVMVAFVALQAFRRHSEETLGAVQDRLERQCLLGYMQTPAPLKAKDALI